MNDTEPEFVMITDPGELRARWADLQADWAAATARAEALPAGAVDERVAGEWSFAETLRHLVYATDAWLSRPVLGGQPAFWSAALPHSSLPDARATACGIDRRAKPSWAATRQARTERQAIVTAYVANVSTTDLDRRCAAGAEPPGLGADSDTLTVGDCLNTIIEEEVAHLGYATRDLDALEEHPTGRRREHGSQS